MGETYYQPSVYGPGRGSYVYGQSSQNIPPYQYQTYPPPSQVEVEAEAEAEAAPPLPPPRPQPFAAGYPPPPPRPQVWVDEHLTPPPLPMRPAAVTASASAPVLTQLAPNAGGGGISPAASASPSPMPSPYLMPSPSPSPSLSPRTLELRVHGHFMVCAEPHAFGTPLLTVTYGAEALGEGSPDMIALRGNALGPRLATVRFHRWTTLKAEVDMTASDGVSSDGKIKVWKEFDSVTGLGKVKWEGDGGKSMKMRAIADKKSKGKDKDKDKDTSPATTVAADGVIARFRAASNAKKTSGPGYIELVRDGLTSRQLEEIVISCLVVRERTRRTQETLKEGAVELISQGIGAA
ncbi:hypothetical protein BX600DRAFT_510025 [Xylariales sp. PMI_506]|nr:hypothetical protein BX600DRAFT_510025 [Xylariales sp. PMI_506]